MIKLFTLDYSKKRRLVNQCRVKNLSWFITQIETEQDNAEEAIAIAQYLLTDLTLIISSSAVGVSIAARILA